MMWTAYDVQTTIGCSVAAIVACQVWLSSSAANPVGECALARCVASHVACSRCVLNYSFAAIKCDTLALAKAVKGCHCGRLRAGAHAASACTLQVVGVLCNLHCILPIGHQVHQREHVAMIQTVQGMSGHLTMYLTSSQYISGRCGLALCAYCARMPVPRLKWR